MSIANRFKQDNVYFNVEFLGSSTIPNQLMVYDTTLNESIVDNSMSYYLAVVDFAIPLTSVPIMICPMKPNGLLTNETTMTITFVVNGVPMPIQTVIFTPEDLTASQINQNDPNQMIISPYYYLYDYYTMINMLNNTLLAAHTAMAVAFPAYAQSIAKAPFFVYDPSTELITLVTDISYATNIAQINTVNIEINNDLLTYLEGFSYKYLLRSGIPYSQFQIYTYLQNHYPNNTFPAAIVSPSYIQTIQSYDNMPAWSDLKKIIIVSNSLPVAGESIQRGSNVNNIVNTQYVLSSFTPEVIKAGDQRSTIYYNPASQYRLLDIISDIDIRRIDISIYWEDFKNNWYIMNIQPNDNASVRLAFVKRDLYKSNLLKKM